MTPDTQRCTIIFLAAALAQAPGVAEMFLRLHPDGIGAAREYLAAVERLRRYAESGRGGEWRDTPMFAEVGG